MTNAFKTIYRLLNRLEKGLDADDFDAAVQIGSKAPEITDNRWRNYIKMLLKDGYIEGVDIRTVIDSEEDIDISEIQITIKGLEYLAKNTMMIRAYNTVKSIKYIVK
ncbi:MAG: YjcQ family protein [Treponema sp.]|nr:YjcQ family protein [Treponema sp.]